MDGISREFVKVTGIVVNTGLNNRFGYVRLAPNTVGKNLGLLFYKHCTNQPEGDPMRSGDIWAFRVGDRVEGYIDPKQPTDEIFAATLTARGAKPGFFTWLFN